MSTPRDPQVLLYPDVCVRIYRVLADMEKDGHPMRVTEGLRSLKRQEALYAQGRTAPGPKVTDSRPGSSLHHYGCAADFCFQGSDPYPKDRSLWLRFASFAQAHGFTWGGDWNKNGAQDPNDYDLPHVQLTYGLTLDKIRSLYEARGLEAVWAQFDNLRGVRESAEWRARIQQSKAFLEV